MKTPSEIFKEKLPRVYYYLLDWKDENINSNFYPIHLRKPLKEFTFQEINILWNYAHSHDEVTWETFEEKNAEK